MRLSFILFLIVITVNITSAQSPASANKEWHNYGNDAGGKRYSPVKQINDANVKKMKQAWVYHTGELQTYNGTHVIEKAAFEATPVMADGMLYFSTPTCRVFAIDAGTGKEKWVYDPKINLKADYSEITSRGVSIWTSAEKNGQKETRIFIATIDGRLIALQAQNGKPVYTFGNEGSFNLREGFGNEWSVTSPPVIIGNTIVVGSSMGDNQKIDYPKGTVRAYDVLSGALKWSWDPVPRDSTDKAWHTWKNSSASITGAANAWAVISADTERDMVFIPTSSPSPDYYGGERLGQNLYGNSVVALQASTGKMIWYYQVVHHDLWDYDIAAQPVLLDIERNNKRIPAVAIGTKMGHIFILHRETGKPLFPVEERPVPASDVAGEEAWKTQPFPVLPAPIGLQRITEADAWGLTPEDKAEAANRISLYRNEGNFTPPGFKGTIMTPGNVGGIHWGGMCYDEKNQLLITNINRLAALIRIIPREKISELEKQDSLLMRSETGRQRGTPYVMKRTYLFKQAGNGLIMQTQPPWGTILAIDLRTGEKKWETPLGYMMNPQQYPGADKWGSINFGGAIATAGNLTFVAATFDNHLRAFKTQSGELLWQAELPASAQATPMTYEWKGKQYVVIAAGGHGKLGTKQGDSVVAFALE